MTEQDNSRRLAGLESRVESIDLHGTRGMESVRSQLGTMQRDFGKLESTVDRVETAVQAIQLQLAVVRPSARWPMVLGFVAAVTPMYALVIDLIVKQH